jgi:CheY-like chemotaxis protein
LRIAFVQHTVYFAMKQKRPTILIVDDNDDDRDLLQHAFESHSLTCRIQPLVNGQEALAYLKGKGKYANRSKFQFPAYIVTDLHMRPGDGFAILDYIKKHPALSVIPVVMLSSSNDVDDIRTAYSLGASSYLVKPETHEALRRLVKKIHEYWAECEVPEVDESGFALATNSAGKAGERFHKPKRRTRELVH